MKSNLDISGFENFTLLDNVTEHLKQNEKMWNDRIKDYSGVKDYCNENFLYNKDSDLLKIASCKCFSCERCRPKKKYDLLKSIVKSAEAKKLTRHLIITLPGYPFRSLFCNVDESFDYAMKKFNEFRVLYRRNFGKNLSYICLPRAQEDGFCHLHILVGSYISKDWLDDVLNKINLGFPYITFVDVHRLSNYLSKYWYKEHEWFIPKNKKHYTTSADIDIECFLPSFGWYFISVPKKMFSVGCDVVDCVYRCLDFINPFHRPPPFDMMLGYFYEDVHREYGDNYVGFLRKRGVKSPYGHINDVKPLFVKHRQMRIWYSGRSYFAHIRGFKPVKYVRQKRFRRDNKWKPMYDGEIKSM